MTAHDAPAPRAALVFNPVKVADAARLRRLVESGSRRAGWREPLIVETTIDDPGQGLTRAAMDAGASAVIVAGGDGTVRAVAEAVAETKVPLAIVPSGTGNLLARNIPLDLTDDAGIIEAVFDGGTVDVDLGRAELRRPDGESEEHAFVVMAGMGLDAAMIANTRSTLKQQVGWVAYVDGAARSLPNATPFRIMFQGDDQRLHTTKVQSILFANCGSLPAGIELVPMASIVDGELDVALIRARGVFGWLSVFRKVWWDNSVLHRTSFGRRVAARRRINPVRFFTATDIEVASPTPQPVELDGDEFGEVTSIRCRVVPGALRVVVPHGHVASRATEATR